jgi:hypothetical protein
VNVSGIHIPTVVVAIAGALVVIWLFKRFVK